MENNQNRDVVVTSFGTVDYATIDKQYQDNKDYQARLKRFQAKLKKKSKQIKKTKKE